MNAGLCKPLSSARLCLRVQKARAAQLRSLAETADDAADSAYEDWLVWLRSAAREPALAIPDVIKKLALVVQEMAEDAGGQDDTGAAMFSLTLSALLDLVLLPPIGGCIAPPGADPCEADAGSASGGANAGRMQSLCAGHD